jgi:hypothetical protein
MRITRANTSRAFALEVRAPTPLDAGELPAGCINVASSICPPPWFGSPRQMQDGKPAKLALPPVWLALAGQYREAGGLGISRPDPVQEKLAYPAKRCSKQRILA